MLKSRIVDDHLFSILVIDIINSQSQRKKQRASSLSSVLILYFCLCLSSLSLFDARVVRAYSSSVKAKKCVLGFQSIC
jgi:hypothetical protein